MTSRSSADETIAERADGEAGGRKERLLRHAQQVADTGDRWFVSLAQGLGQIGAWARREKDVVAESAVAAAATTSRVVGPLAGRLRPGRRAARAADGERATSADAETLRPVTVSEAAASEEPAVFEGPALKEEAVVFEEPVLKEEPAVPEEPATDGGAAVNANPPGVLPVLEVLGKVVTDHEDTQYSSLQSELYWVSS